MSGEPGRSGGAAGLIDRTREREALDGLIAAVSLGQDRALVMRGDPGMGKSALLDHVAGRARDCRLARVAGVQSEMENENR